MCNGKNTHFVLAVLALTWTALVAVPTEAFADRLVLQNGDSLTGAVASVSKFELTIDTELAGRVTIHWAAISSLTSPALVRLTTAAGQTAEGPLVASNGRFSIQQANGQTLSADLGTVRALEMATPLTGAAAWHGAVNAGVDLSRGNAETSTVSTSGTVTRLGPNDRLGLFGTYLFSAIGSGADAVTAARAVRGGVRYDHDLVGRVFGFAFGDAENDPLQLLDLRAVVGGGAGAHLLKSSTAQFNVFGGVSYAKDSYIAETTTTTTTTATGPPFTPPGQGGTPPGQSGIKPKRGGTPPSIVRTSLSRNVEEFLIGQDLTHQLSNGVSLTEALTMYPAIGDLQDYRVSFDLSLSAQLNGWLQWNVTLADRYLNIPPAGGAIQNDMFISAGLGITFGRGNTGAYTGADGRRPPPERKR